MRILYLNVNGFFENEDKKTIINDNNKNINIVRKKQKCGIYHDSSEAILNKIKEYWQHNIFFDMIFLSEIDPNSPITKKFITEITDEESVVQYEVLPPYNVELTELRGYSCTICLKLKGLEYTNLGNNFHPDIKSGDYLALCKILSKEKDIILLGIHRNRWNKEFQSSLKKLLTIDSEKTKVLLFGDTNANPDADDEQAEAQKDNQSFVELITKSGLKNEIYPDPVKNTTNFGKKGGTRIDRVFTNIPKDQLNVTVESSFLDEGLSDHAALIITFKNHKFKIANSPMQDLEKFEKLQDVTDESVKKYTSHGVWALIGRKKDKPWIALQVGQASNIGAEIISDVKCLSEEQITVPKCKYINQFGQVVDGYEYHIYPIPREQIYKQIGEKYDDFIFICICCGEKYKDNKKAIEKYVAWQLRALFWRNGRPFKTEKTNVEEPRNIIINDCKLKKDIDEMVCWYKKQIK